MTSLPGQPAPAAARCPLEERQDRGVEDVVLVARDHVIGPRHVDELGMRHVVEEALHALGGHDPAEPSAYQQRRQLQGAGRGHETLGLLLRVRAARALDELRIPVPAPAAVGSLAQVAPQAIEVLRRLAVRQVRGHRGAGLLDGGEAVQTGAHEGEDLAGAGRFDPRDHVDQDEPARVDPRLLAQRGDGGEPAERRPDDEGTTARRAGRAHHGAQVVHEAVERVLTLGRAIAVAVATLIDRDGEEAATGQRRDRLSPRRPRLSAAVEHEDGDAALGAFHVGNELHSRSLKLANRHEPPSWTFAPTFQSWVKPPSIARSVPVA